MAIGFGGSTSRPPESSSGAGNDAADFECNICFELAQDPIVTLCGHLYCWPCLYRWLNHHSQSHECPVCKAFIQEEKLVPLYGRGNAKTDPRFKSYPGMEIPRRPAAQRPETAPHPEDNNNIPNYGGFGFMGGFMPMSTARIGNFTLSTAFIGLSLIPSLFTIQFHPDATVYGTTSGYPHVFHANRGGRGREPASQERQADNSLKNLFFLIGILIIIFMVWG